MAKKEIAQIKLQVPAGQANPTPPVGPALGQHGVNIMEFCKTFNAQTQEKQGLIVPNRDKVGTVSSHQVREIAEMKMPDLNAASMETAMSMIAGTARSMGLLIDAPVPVSTVEEDNG